MSEESKEGQQQPPVNRADYEVAHDGQGLSNDYPKDAKAWHNRSTPPETKRMIKFVSNEHNLPEEQSVDPNHRIEPSGGSADEGVNSNTTAEDWYKAFKDEREGK